MNKKRRITSLLVVVMILISIVPGFAQQNQTPMISQWAVGDLVEGERLATYPQNWYYEGFKTEITSERLNHILDMTSKKIKVLGYEESKEYIPVKFEGTTRKAFVTGLYNIIKKYK